MRSRSLTLREPPDHARDELLPVVTYAVKRRIASGKPDYWDYATLLELAVIAEDEAQLETRSGDCAGHDSGSVGTRRRLSLICDLFVKRASDERRPSRGCFKSKPSLQRGNLDQHRDNGFDHDKP
jgi:hypothetical protein